MNRRPERLGDLLPGVVAELSARHATNGAPMPAAAETVWRYMLPLTDEPVVRIPTRARVLSVGPPRTGEAHLDLWALVDPTAEEETREFRIVGTGNPMPRDAGRYVGTTHSHGGALIWHVFEANERARLDGAA